MSEKTTHAKSEKQAVKEQPTELKDEQLDEIQGGATAGRSSAARSPAARQMSKLLKFNPDLTVP